MEETGGPERLTEGMGKMPPGLIKKRGAGQSQMGHNRGTDDAGWFKRQKG